MWIFAAVMIVILSFCVRPVWFTVDDVDDMSFPFIPGEMDPKNESKV